MKPVIGLSTYRVDAQWGVWSGDAVLLPTTYTGSVEAVGAIAALLPPPPPDAGPAAIAAAAQTLVGRIDGLMIAGGSDVDPASYGAEPHPETEEPNAPRDRWEFALLEAADRVRLPVLGICRGIQVMAVHNGGTLHQHVPDVIGNADHSPGGATYGTISVTVEADSRLGALVAPEHSVSCHHHQAVDRHPGLTVTARSTDGVIEALEAPGDRFYVGVQWHPEERSDTGLFAGFVAAAG